MKNQIKLIILLSLTFFFSIFMFVEGGNGQSNSDFAFCTSCPQTGGCAVYGAPGDTVSCSAEGCMCGCIIEWFDPQNGPQLITTTFICYN